jgi:hypothetical protein
VGTNIQNVFQIVRIFHNYITISHSYTQFHPLTDIETVVTAQLT